MEITDDRWLVEAIFLAQLLDLLGIDALTLGLEFRHIAFEIVAGRKFDNGEDECRDDRQRRHHHEDAPYDVAQHL